MIIWFGIQILTLNGGRSEVGDSQIDSRNRPHNSSSIMKCYIICHSAKCGHWSN